MKKNKEKKKKRRNQKLANNINHAISIAKDIDYSSTADVHFQQIIKRFN